MRYRLTVRHSGEIVSFFGGREELELLMVEKFGEIIDEGCCSDFADFKLASGAIARISFA